MVIVYFIQTKGRQALAAKLATAFPEFIYITVTLS